MFRCSIPAASNGVLCVLQAPDGSVFLGSGDGTVKRFRGSDSRWAMVAETSLRWVSVLARVLVYSGAYAL